MQKIQKKSGRAYNNSSQYRSGGGRAQDYHSQLNMNNMMAVSNSNNIHQGYKGSQKYGENYEDNMEVPSTDQLQFIANSESRSLEKEFVALQ